MTEADARGPRIRHTLSVFLYMALYVVLVSVVSALVPFLRDYLHVVVGVGTLQALYVSWRAYREGPADAPQGHAE